MKEKVVLSTLYSTFHSRCHDSMYSSISSSLFGIIHGCYGGLVLFLCFRFYFCFFFFFSGLHLCSYKVKTSVKQLSTLTSVMLLVSHQHIKATFQKIKSFFSHHFIITEYMQCDMQVALKT